MKKDDRKTGILILIFILIVVLVSGCKDDSGGDNNSASTDVSGLEAAPREETPLPDGFESSQETVPKEEPLPDEFVDCPETAAEDETLPRKFEYSFDPHVISEAYCLICGEGINEEFFSFCDVILRKEETFSCSSKERFHQLLSISNSCFPLAQELVDKEKTTVNNGVCHLVYRYDEGKMDELILLFKNKVTDVITSAIPYEASDSIKAMELFTAVANKDVYDESCTLEDSLKLRSYRSIVNDVGICQEIAAEYIYYLLQVGIDAFPCSALNSDQSEAHEWALMKLDGEYYHADPTYATNYPDSLYFFGMDDVQREYYGDFPRENFTYAESDVLSGCAATDRTFEKVWLAEKYEIDHANRKIIVQEINTEKRYEYRFEDFQRTF